MTHPAELDEAHVTSFLTHLAVRERVSASTQNQALAALLFLYRQIIGRDLGSLGETSRARTPERLPVELRINTFASAHDNLPSLEVQVLPSSSRPISTARTSSRPIRPEGARQLAQRCGGSSTTTRATASAAWFYPGASLANTRTLLVSGPGSSCFPLAGCAETSGGEVRRDSIFMNRPCNAR